MLLQMFTPSLENKQTNKQSKKKKSRDLRKLDQLCSSSLSLGLQFILPMKVKVKGQCRCYRAVNT